MNTVVYLQSSRRQHQRGLSLLGLLFVGVVLASVVMVGVRIAPSAIEYQAIRKAVRTARVEASPPAIRAAFDRTASVDYISSISGKDLDIVQVTDQRGDGQGYRVSFAYEKEIPLFGPASLLLRYIGSSD
ncbi:DUF4845 domain-containing protein [uncultured Xylophilus sp.]|uniref:DUF4845 domain-containing protein n=1 Tax=uncultured Xylophilus sp. TaxID=296832 RepID=UPI0025DDF12C|nr:DUF4845 domain-containing protein [uncultured Xylophilus sp.]